jgi:hypothetical protein
VKSLMPMKDPFDVMFSGNFSVSNSSSIHCCFMMVKKDHSSRAPSSCASCLACQHVSAKPLYDFRLYTQFQHASKSSGENMR